MNIKYIEKIFQQFAHNKEFFDFEDFKAQMTLNPDLLAWFSKPEEAMNKRLNNRIDETLITKKQMLDQVYVLQKACTKYMDQIGSKLDLLNNIFQVDSSLEEIQG